MPLTTYCLWADIMKVMLTRSPAKFPGRGEWTDNKTGGIVFYDGRPICSRKWNKTSATLLCQLLHPDHKHGYVDFTDEHLICSLAIGMTVYKLGYADFQYIKAGHMATLVACVRSVEYLGRSSMAKNPQNAKKIKKLSVTDGQED